MRGSAPTRCRLADSEPRFAWYGCEVLLPGAVERVSIFAGLPVPERALLVERAATRLYETGAVVVERGAEAECLFGVCTGHLKVVVSTPRGRDVTMGIFGPSDAFGIPALLLNEDRSARVVALDPALLVTLDRAGFEELLARSPTFSRRLLNVLAVRLKQVVEHHEDAESLRVSERIAKKLLTLARDCGQPHARGVQIPIALSQQELADLVGTTRQSINKQLRAWSEAGYVTQEQGRWLVLNEPALQQECSRPPEER